MIDPKRIAVQVAIRAGQMQGRGQISREISYQAGYLALDGRQVPASALRDAVVAVEMELAEVIANDKANPYRSTLKGRSYDLPTGSSIPTREGAPGLDPGPVDPAAASFIGMFSQINDSGDNSPLTEQPVQVIRRYLRGSRYKGAIYNYAFAAGRITHTRPLVYFEGCVFSQPRALARFDTDNTELSPLPNSLESTWVARALEFMAQEGYLVNEASYYANFARSGIERLRARNTDLPVLPTTTATAKPGSN